MRPNCLRVTQPTLLPDFKMLEDNATVLAIIDDITIMGDLEVICRTEAIRGALQVPPNYIVNPLKQNVYTINEHHVDLLKHRLPHHKVTYIG